MTEAQQSGTATVEDEDGESLLTEHDDTDATDKADVDTDDPEVDEVDADDAEVNADDAEVDDTDDVEVDDTDDVEVDDTDDVEVDDTDDVDTDEDEDDEEPAVGPGSFVKGLLVGIGGAVVVAALVAVAAFVWPGFLAGPGAPDDTVNRTVTALSSKDSGTLQGVTCQGKDGQPTSQLPPEALQLIASARQTGPTSTVLDNEARAPLELTLSAQGQSQALPALMLFGVNDGQWCFNGLSSSQ